MGAQASNNFSEDLVNGSNPRYTYSQPTPAQQVAWQVKKEEEARQAQINDTMNRMQKAQNEVLHTPVNSYTPSFSIPTPSFTPSLTSIPSSSSSLGTLPNSQYSWQSSSSSSSLPTYGKYSWET